ncbi:MAG TPA: hypothetical protein VM638_07805 [Actinomycetota bacterium]|nr:hypothetical protein [Actinomycetota bacterium]
MPRPRSVVTIALALAFVSAACGQKAGVQRDGRVGGDPGPTEPAPIAPLPATDAAGAVMALCAAEAAAATGDVEGMRSAFEDRAHAFLHQFADTLQATDPAIAAGLLEAKQQVEAGLADGTPPPEMAARLAALRSQVEQGAAANGTPTQGCA